MPATSTYKIVPSTGFYPQLNALLIALQGVAVAAELRVIGAVAHNVGDYLTVQAKHLQEEVRVPLVGPVEAALANRKPDEVHLTVVHGTTSSNHAYWTSGFAEFVDAIFLPFLVNYHNVTAQKLRQSIVKAALHGLYHGKCRGRSVMRPLTQARCSRRPRKHPSRGEALPFVRTMNLRELFFRWSMVLTYWSCFSRWRKPAQVCRSHAPNHFINWEVPNLCFSGAGYVQSF